MGVVPMFGVGVVGTSSHRIRVVDNERDCNTALRAADSEAIITGASGRGKFACFQNAVFNVAWYVLVRLRHLSDCLPIFAQIFRLWILSQGLPLKLHLFNTYLYLIGIH